MSLKKVILSTVAAATLTSGLSAAVTVEADHVGNNLKFPVYYAIESAGWHTKVRVANLNSDRSIVAKLVVRESTRSVEKLDILLYLSPTDVFDADIREENGKVVLATVDDSVNLDPNDPSGRISVNSDGETVVTLADPLAADNAFADERAQNNNFGYVEVYGLIEHAGTASYGTKTCTQEQSSDVAFGRDGNVSNAAAFSSDCNGTIAGTVKLSAAGVDHDKFVKAALYDYDAANMGTLGWHEVQDGLTGEAVILSSNANGHLAMAYQAVALQNSDANDTNVSIDAITPAAQRGQDTNFLVWNNAKFIEDIEDGIAKTETYVMHYSKDGRLPTKANNVGDMAETRLLANFVTKKYSVESYHYLAHSPYPTYGINYAGGNLFYPEACTKNDTSGNNTTYICGRNVRIGGVGHDHYEAAPSSIPGSGVSGGNPGTPTAARTDNNEIVSIDVRNDSSYADGYVAYKFTGVYDRNESNATTVMPYIPMVMSAVTFSDGTNVTNIKYPAYKDGNLSAGLGVNRNVTVYSDANATAHALPSNTNSVGYDLTTETYKVK